MGELADYLKAEAETIHNSRQITLSHRPRARMASGEAIAGVRFHPSALSVLLSLQGQ
jgi:hypothetical protein